MAQEGEPVIRIGELLVRSGVITATDLSEAEKLSSHMKVQFGRLLIMAGCLTEEALECALEAQGLCRQGLMTSEIAIEALAFAVSENISLQEALEVLDVLPQFGTSTLKLAELLHDANIIDEEKLQDAFDTSMETNKALAEVLVEMQCISPTLLPILQRMQDQIRTETLDRDDAINELRGTFKIWKKADKALSDDPMAKSAIIGSKNPNLAPAKPSRFTSSFDTYTKVPAMTPDTAASIMDREQAAGNDLPPATSSASDVQPLPSAPQSTTPPTVGYVHPGERNQPQRSAAAAGDVDWVLHHYGAGGIAHPAGHPARIQQEAFNYADDDEQRISDLLDIFASETSTSQGTASQAGKTSSPGVSPLARGAESFTGSRDDNSAQAPSQPRESKPQIPPGWMPHTPKSPSSSSASWARVPSSTGEVPSLPGSRGFGRDTGNNWQAMPPSDVGRADKTSFQKSAKAEPQATPELRTPGQPKSPRKTDAHEIQARADEHTNAGQTKGLGHPDRVREQPPKGHTDQTKDEAKGLGHPDFRARGAELERSAAESADIAATSSNSVKPPSNPFTVSKRLSQMGKSEAPAAPSPAEESSDFHDELARQLMGESETSKSFSTNKDYPLVDEFSQSEQTEALKEKARVDSESSPPTSVDDETHENANLEYRARFEYPEHEAEAGADQFAGNGTEVDGSDVFVNSAEEFFSPGGSHESSSAPSAGSTSSSFDVQQLGSISGEHESLFSVRFRDVDSNQPPIDTASLYSLRQDLPPFAGDISAEAQAVGETAEDEQTKTANRLQETRARRAAKHTPAEPQPEAQDISDDEPGFTIDFSTESERAELEATESVLDENEVSRAAEEREREELEAEAREAEDREREEIKAREEERARDDEEKEEKEEKERQELEAREAEDRAREEEDARRAAEEKERDELENEARAAEENERREIEAKEAEERESAAEKNETEQAEVLLEARGADNESQEVPVILADGIADFASEEMRSEIEKAVLEPGTIDIADVKVETISEAFVGPPASAESSAVNKAAHKKLKDDKRKGKVEADETADFVGMLEAARFFSEGELHDAITQALSDPHKAVEILSTIGVIDRSYLDAAVRLHKLLKSHTVDYHKAIESLDAMREGKLKPADLTNQLGMKKPKRRK